MHWCVPMPWSHRELSRPSSDCDIGYEITAWHKTSLGSMSEQLVPGSASAARSNSSFRSGPRGSERQPTDVTGPTYHRSRRSIEWRGTSSCSPTWSLGETDHGDLSRCEVLELPFEVLEVDYLFRDAPGSFIEVSPDGDMSTGV